MREGFRPISNPHNHVSTLHLQNPHPGPPLKGEGGKEPSLLREPKHPN
jgi:hypothetical protein